MKQGSDKKPTKLTTMQQLLLVFGIFAVLIVMQMILGRENFVIAGYIIMAICAIAMIVVVIKRIRNKQPLQVLLLPCVALILAIVSFLVTNFC